MNLIIVSGNLAKDARLLKTNSGKSCLVTTLAVREDLRPETRNTLFLDLILWGERAEKLSQYLTKGKAISVIGRLEVNKNIKNNNTYITPRVVVDTLEFISKKESDPQKEEIVEETVDETTDSANSDSPISSEEVSSDSDEVPF